MTDPNRATIGLADIGRVISEVVFMAVVAVGTFATSELGSRWGREFAYGSVSFERLAWLFVGWSVFSVSLMALIFVSAFLPLASGRPICSTWVYGVTAMPICLFFLFVAFFLLVALDADHHDISPASGLAGYIMTFAVPTLVLGCVTMQLVWLAIRRSSRRARLVNLCVTGGLLLAGIMAALITCIVVS